MAHKATKLFVAGTLPRPVQCEPCVIPWRSVSLGLLDANACWGSDRVAQ